MKIIAINSDTSLCECCGKRNLKKVVVMQKDSGEIVRYGVDCAAKAQGKKRGEVEADVEVAELAQRLLGKYAPELALKAMHNRGYCGAILTGNRMVIKGLIDIQF